MITRTCLGSEERPRLPLRYPGIKLCGSRLKLTSWYTGRPLLLPRCCLGLVMLCAATWLGFGAELPGAIADWAALSWRACDG